MPAFAAKTREGREGGTEGGGVYVLYLSVFFLLLAFFILLTSLSDFKRPKADAILAGLQGVFGPLVPNPQEGSPQARALARAGSVAHLLVGDIPGARLAPPVPHAASLVVTVPLDALFSRDEAGLLRVADRWQPLMTRLAGVLVPAPSPSSGGKPAAPIILEFLVGDGGHDDEGAVADGVTPVTAAGAVARALVSAGAPVSRMTVGIERGPAGTGRFLFTVLPPDGAGGDGVGGEP